MMATEITRRGEHRLPLLSRSPLFVRRISAAIRAQDHRSDLGQKLSICFMSYGYRFVICGCGCGCGYVFTVAVCSGFVEDFWWVCTGCGGTAWRGLAVGRGFGLRGGSLYLSTSHCHNPVFFRVFFFFFLDLPDLLDF